ncbi:1-acyl-sn-glycerol-3-phosphate acyltransferase [Baaleninema sp.]|uniref:1-acyl-sn-glycerol-3-phosphate acyltransferase n=1 Tax=Baaleninema sp. TaxID=3101197 RepID=UPI003D05AA55
MAIASPPLEFIPPDFNPGVRQLAKLALPLVRRWKARIQEVRGENVERLAQLYRQFCDGETRLLVAFRHPQPTDPLCLASLMWELLPQVARQQAIDLPSPTHFHFIYDRGIPLWLGRGTGWAFSKLGGTSLRRGQLDWVGLRSARELLAFGRFPMAAAPEGATNGHNEIISPLEPGVAQLAFWAAEDLQKAGKSHSVAIVPLGIQYEFVSPPWRSIARRLQELEIACGLDSEGLDPDDFASPEDWLYPRLYRLGGRLVVLMEQFYARTYQQPLPHEGEMPQSNAELSERLQALLDAALQVSESYFHLRPKGSAIDRCRRVEQAGWERIYREEMKQPERLSAVERGLLDRIAAESQLRMWHMRLVEHFVAVTGDYVREKPTVERFADTLALLQETFNQICDRSQPLKPLGDRRVRLTVGDSLSTLDFWDTYTSGRRGSRQAVADLTQQLQGALEQTIR